MCQRRNRAYISAVAPACSHKVTHQQTQVVMLKIKASAADVANVPGNALPPCAPSVQSIRVFVRFFVRNRYFSLHTVLVCRPFAAQVSGAAESGTAKVTPTSITTLDFRSLPIDAFTHSRMKWGRGLFILIDDDAGAPSLYVFDRSGHIQFDAMIQITGANKVRVDDFTAAPDGSVWMCGHADSPAGQRSFFLANVTNDGQPVRIIRTNPYRSFYLTVAPDGTVWTVGYGLSSDGRVYLTQDSLRHFDSSGKLSSSAIPANSVGIMRVMKGSLDFRQGRLAWYSPTSGVAGPRSVSVETYVEISPTDMTVLHSYPAAPRNPGAYVLGFALTPSGRVFVQVFHPAGGQSRSPDLYELDRNGNKWVLADGPRNRQGSVSALEGNEDESLVFSDGVADQSELKLQIMDLSQTLNH